MTEHCRFWIVSVPTVGGSVARTLATLASATAALGQCANNELRVPRLQIGTLDMLMGLSDTIAKIDEQTEAIVKKIAKQCLDTIEERSDKKLSQRSETALFVDNDSPASYVRKFTWDRARYPLSAPLDSLTETISISCVKYGEDLRMLSHKYTEARTNLTALNRKESGSLLVRPLSSVVGPKDMVEGEYLESIIVIVSIAREKEWLSTYEKIEDEYVPPENEPEANPFTTHFVKCRAVVPGSSLELHRDLEYIAYRIVLIKKYAHIFKEPAKVKRFTCREYHYDEAEVANFAAAKLQLQKEADYLWRNLIKWCATAYSEVFKAWIHIKVIRVFIESVLRFGLPIDFAAATLEVKPEKEEALRSALRHLYSNLTGASMTQAADEVDYSGVGTDFYPYVFLKIDV